MNQEEYLPDDASIDNEYVCDDDSDETSSGVDTLMNERRRINREYKKLDKGYYCINYIRKGKNYKIESYSTPVLTNGFIRHATSGAYLEHRVGSKFEDLYFIVTDSTAPYCKDHLEPRKLYYNNPEEFERHRLTLVSQPIKETWNDKFIKARTRVYRY
jgi:hypothetical protein